MTTSLGRLAVFACLLGAVGCERQSPAAPSPIAQVPPPAPAPRTRISFPPLSGPSRTFVFERQLSYPVSDYTRHSRIVLFDNGALALEYPTLPAAGTLGGQYRHTDGALMVLFAFPDGRYADEAWDDATLRLNGDSLTIEYEEQMQHADWENAVYVRR
jgi:hypothetical protein